MTVNFASIYDYNNYFCLFLGMKIDSLFPLGTSDTGNIVLLANGNSVLHLTINASSLELLLSAIFSINPDMSLYNDDLLPQYVGKLAHAQVVWPLLFTLTEDGIICILYNKITRTYHPGSFVRMYMYVYTL